ncbi:murein biosynthesis integral membrane protein MurJ [Phenylobacterium sp.]|uniref:murein biosynthesis integral membrane protein MurJ n=1 Tax=Phenylobacterium sp. TaxID=1871053 RepID=UPI0025E88EE3|nr:murein biosynthesis integral membrane protein MurJ [Phenylobacterium sp.]
MSTEPPTETARDTAASQAGAAPQPPAKRAGLLRSSVIFSALTLFSRVLGLVRDLVVTARLGASLTIAADAYYTALAFPNLFRRIFAEGAFAAAFVPDYAKRLEGDGEGEADRFAADAAAGLAAVTVALTVVAQLAMPWLMFVINPGYVDEPEKFRLSVILTQITMPYLPCMAIAALFSGILNAHGRFIVSGFYPTILNVVMLAIVWPQTDPIRAAYAASIGVIIAGIGQAALVIWAARKSGARVRLVRPRLTPEMKALTRRAIPAAIANSATQINIFISGILASQVAGARVWLNVADRLYQLPMSLVGVAIGVALLPRLAQSLRRGDHDDAKSAMDQGLIFGLALSLPAAAALMAMPVYLIDGLFTRGAFVAADAAATGALLFHYGWGTPAFVLQRILQPAFFAREDTKTPMRFALISVAINVAAGVALFFVIGVPGIAAATSLAAWIAVIQMLVALWRKGDYRPSAFVTSKILRVALASAVMGAALAFAAANRAAFEAPLRALDLPLLGAKEIGVVVLSLAGLLLYGLLVFVFGGVTRAELRSAVTRRNGASAPTPADVG